MSHHLRNCDIDVKQALRRDKLDPTTFKEDIERSLDSAGRFFSNQLGEIRSMVYVYEGRCDRAIEEWEKVQFKLNECPPKRHDVTTAEIPMMPLYFLPLSRGEGLQGKFDLREML